MKDELDRLYEKRKKEARRNAFIRKLRKLCKNYSDVAEILDDHECDKFEGFDIRVDKEN